jgi:hypothetical protein
VEACILHARVLTPLKQLRRLRISNAGWRTSDRLVAGLSSLPRLECLQVQQGCVA